MITKYLKFILYKENTSTHEERVSEIIKSYINFNEDILDGAYMLKDLGCEIKIKFGVLRNIGMIWEDGQYICSPSIRSNKITPAIHFYVSLKHKNYEEAMPDNIDEYYKSLKFFIKKLNKYYKSIFLSGILIKDNNFKEIIDTYHKNDKIICIGDKITLTDKEILYMCNFDKDRVEMYNDKLYFKFNILQIYQHLMIPKNEHSISLIGDLFSTYKLLEYLPKKDTKVINLKAIIVSLFKNLDIESCEKISSYLNGGKSIGPIIDNDTYIDYYINDLSIINSDRNIKFINKIAEVQKIAQQEAIITIAKKLIAYYSVVLKTEIIPVNNESDIYDPETFMMCDYLFKFNPDWLKISYDVLYYYAPIDALEKWCEEFKVKKVLFKKIVDVYEISHKALNKHISNFLFENNY